MGAACRTVELSTGSYGELRSNLSLQRTTALLQPTPTAVPPGASISTVVNRMSRMLGQPDNIVVDHSTDLHFKGQFILSM